MKHLCKNVQFSRKAFLLYFAKADSLKKEEVVSSQPVASVKLVTIICLLSELFWQKIYVRE